IEILRIDDRGIDVGEHLELARAAHVVAVAGRAVADDPAAVGPALVDELHLAGLVGLNHAVLLRHPPDPAVALDAHAVFPAACGQSRHCRAGQRRPEPGAAAGMRACGYSSEAEIPPRTRGRLSSSSSSRRAVAR